MTQMDGKVAVIAGAGSGLGEVTAKLLAKRGAKVAVGDIVVKNAEKVAAEIVAAGGTAMAVRFDLDDADSIAAMMDTAAKAFGRLDFMHANAALVTPEVAKYDLDIEQTPIEIWDRVQHANLRGTMLCCRFAIPHMLKNGGGSIVNTGSALSLRGNLGQIAYTTSKAAIIQLTRSIATSHGKRGIRCNAVLPGLTVTDYVKRNVPQAFLDFVLGETPSPQLGEPIDLANSIAFLASDDARQINGHVLVVDGGETVHMPGMAALAALSGSSILKE